MSITIEDIQKKQFSVKSRGYDKAEVDNFLEDIMAQMDSTDNELNELRRKCSALYETINDYKKTEDTMKELLVLAKDKHDQIISDAKAEADKMLENAKAESETLVAQANEKYAEMTNGMDQEVEKLRIQTASMKAEYTLFKQKIEDLLQAQIQMFRDMDNEETAAPEEKE